MSLLKDFQSLYTHVGSAEAVNAFGRKRLHFAPALVAVEPNRQDLLCDQPRVALLLGSMNVRLAALCDSSI